MMDGIVIPLICGLFTNQSDADLFRARLNAYQMACYIGQRTRGFQMAEKNAEFDDLCAAVISAGGTAIPQGDIQAAITALRTQLESTIPVEAGPPRINLLQQIEDVNQMGAWVDDVLELGILAKLDKSMINPTKTRGDIQAENGILV
ncbi:MAG: hypothetical protein LBG95_07180 [Treponema sp.]|jgi:hypothetical protein|nr:hypothetical protein [Treponema sp.]